MSRVGHTPLRRCIACRSVRPKADLLRFVADEGLRLTCDPAQKAAGRGAYCCKNNSCIEKAVGKNLFARSMRRNVQIKNPDQWMDPDIRRATILNPEPNIEGNG